MYNASYQAFKLIGLKVQEKKRKHYFQDSGHLGFPIRMILVIFDRQVTPMLPTKFQAKWPLGAEEAQNKFSRWPPWRPSWISDWKNFSFLGRCFLPSFKSTGFFVQEKQRTIDFQDGCHGDHLGFQKGRI